MHARSHGLRDGVVVSCKFIRVYVNLTVGTALSRGVQPHCNLPPCPARRRIALTHAYVLRRQNGHIKTAMLLVSVDNSVQHSVLSLLCSLLWTVDLVVEPPLFTPPHSIRLLLSPLCLLCLPKSRTAETHKRKCSNAWLVNCVSRTDCTPNTLPLGRSAAQTSSTKPCYHHTAPRQVDHFAASWLCRSHTHHLGDLHPFIAS